MGFASSLIQKFKNLVRSKRDEPTDRYIYLGPTAGVTVNEETAIKLDAVWACVRLVSETIACLPWHVIKRQDGRREQQSEHPVDWLIHTQPNPEMDAFNFRQLLTAWSLMWGNGYAEIERDRAGRPLWLWPIAPDRVEVVRAEDESLWYEVSNFVREKAYIPASDMFHLRGLGFDGMSGQNVIQMMAGTIGLGLAAQEEKQAFYRNGCRFGGFWVNKGATMSDVAEKNFLTSINRRHQGPKKAFNIGLVQGTLEWEDVTSNYIDAEVLGSERFTVERIARYFRVQPHKIGDLSRATFSNIEHQSIEFVTDTIMPWVVRWESEANMKLFGRQQRGGYVTKMNLASLLRGDNASRAAFYTAMRNLGAFSVNQILEFEDMNPIGPDGDKRLVQLNLTTLEKVGEDPPQSAQQPAESEQEGDEPAAGPPKPAQKADNMAQLASVCAKAVKRECHRVRDAIKRGEEFGPWLDKFYAEHKSYLTNKLTPPVSSIVNEAEPARITTLVELIATQAVEESRQSLKDAHDSGDVEALLEQWVSERPSQLADSIRDAAIVVASLTKRKVAV